MDGIGAAAPIAFLTRRCSHFPFPTSDRKKVKQQIPKRLTMDNFESKRKTILDLAKEERIVTLSFSNFREPSSFYQVMDVLKSLMKILPCDVKIISTEGY